MADLATVYQRVQNYWRLFNHNIKKSFGDKYGRFNRNEVIILGNQKSGTTAIAALFAKATGLDSSLDLPPVWEPNLGKLYLGELHLKDIAGDEKYLFSRKIIKEPNLTFFYAQVKNVYPHSKYIFIIRDPLQNIRSLLNRINVPGNLSSAKPFLNNLDIHSVSLFSDIYYSFYSEHYIEMLAMRWKYCANLYLSNRESFELVKYEDFAQNKQQYIEKLVKRMDLEVKNNISEWLDHQFQPKGNAQVDLRQFFGSNYSKVINICADEMQAFGYKS